MLHSKGQITLATKEFHTEKSMRPKFGPHIVSCIDMFTIQNLGLTLSSMQWNCSSFRLTSLMLSLRMIFVAIRNCTNMLARTS